MHLINYHQKSSKIVCFAGFIIKSYKLPYITRNFGDKSQAPSVNQV